MTGLKGKNVIVTGAARGIGFAVAESFAEKGARVFILDLNPESVDAACEKLKDKGFDAVGIAADVTDSESIEENFKKIKKEFGSADVLVNNAGITRDTLILKMNESDWDSVLDINLKGAFLCIQKISRIMMKQRDGVIINMASIIGLTGNAGQANYAASKAGLIALTKSAAKEFASRNIRVNAVAPGFIETEMTAKLSEEIIAEYAKAIPLKKMGKPQDIANACLFLASDEARYITGQTLTVDGGLVM
ncbi:MAG: 3-oxoacyl-ACP reductase [Candidatus Cloacimonadota bacterium]|nr:MAG: 3-oxoacyl-ACP reductase [Candidatus Cloacimonadota bacterium]